MTAKTGALEKKTVANLLCEIRTLRGTLCGSFLGYMHVSKKNQRDLSISSTFQTADV